MAAARSPLGTIRKSPLEVCRAIARGGASFTRPALTVNLRTPVMAIAAITPRIAAWAR